MATLNVISNKTSIARDAEDLYLAFKGLGTDEETIITILGHRNADQRQLIIRAYKDLFRGDLIKSIESELSGDFERAVYRWMLEPADRDAVLAHVAIKQGSKHYNVLVEIVSVLSPEELLNVRRAYHIRYKRSLEEDVATHTTGDLRQLLVGLVTTFRYGGDEVNAKLAKTEADILHESIKEKKGNHEEAIIRILTTRSKAQLLATFNSYRDDHDTSITKKLLDDASDDFHKALHTAIRCISDYQKYYEKVLRNAIKKIGSEGEDAITRVVVSRAEKDMKDIKELYYKKNSVNLEDAIAKEFHGDYKNFILTLLGKNVWSTCSS